MPKVSVCLPVYNGARYLSQAIESVLGQTFADFELLIADDCSTDNSAEIARQYAVKDSRIRLWTNERNKGLFANYNACIEKATGEFIKPFAQDDVLAPAMLDRQLQVFAKQPSVRLVSTAKCWIGADGSVLKTQCQFPEDRLIPGIEVIVYNMAQLTNWVGEPSTVMFRRADAGTGFDTRFYHYGDIEYWFRLVESGNFYFLAENLCSFRRHEQSSTTGNLAGLYFALDVLLLGKLYGRHCQDKLGETEEHFVRRALEVIALNVDHLVRSEGLDAQRALSFKKQAEDVFQQQKQADGFRELSFHALRLITSLIAEYDALRCRTEAERDLLQKQIEDMRQSTSWRITAPLRQLAGGNSPRPS